MEKSSFFSKKGGVVHGQTTPIPGTGSQFGRPLLGSSWGPIIDPRYLGPQNGCPFWGPRYMGSIIEPQLSK